MIKKLTLLLIFCLFTHLVIAQNKGLSPMSKISLLTVGTGEDLAAKFGHSAIRLQDASLGIDEVYGYGTYDFEDPNFYLNFTRGKLSYTISRMPFKYFEYSYKVEQRWIKEQDLNLTLEQRQNIINFLENNLKPENKKYKYDFLFDNCATRIPMVFEKTLGEGLEFNFDHLEHHYTFRELIRQNLNPNSWSNFGIDLALGAVIDRKATPYEHMFLPLYVYQQIKNTTLKGTPIVKKERIILDIETKNHQLFFLLTPAFWLALLFVLVCFITYKDVKTQRRTKWLDFILFLITGLAGVLIVFLWFATDHLATKMNLNTFWAFAPNAVVAFFLLKTEIPNWIKKYLIIVLVLLATSVIIWFFKIQVFSILITPILLALAIRHLFLITSFKRM